MNEAGRKLRLTFNAKRHLNRLEKNFRDGKKTIVKDSHLEEVEEPDGETEGGAIINWKKLGRTLKDAGNKVKAVVKPIVDSKVTKGIVKELAPVLIPVAEEGVSAAVGSQSNPIAGKMAGKAAGKLLTKGVSEYTKGAGFGVRRMHAFPHGGSFAPLGGSFKPLGSGIEQIEFQQSGIVPGPNSQVSRSQMPQSMAERMQYVRSFKGTKQG
jgi:hypothetical protein